MEGGGLENVFKRQIFLMYKKFMNEFVDIILEDEIFFLTIHSDKNSHNSLIMINYFFFVI